MTTMTSVDDFKEALGQVPLTSWLKLSAGLVCFLCIPSSWVQSKGAVCIERRSRVSREN
jgi:hypothetical protein